MINHPIILDLFLNIICIVTGVYLGYFLSTKTKLTRFGDNFLASIGFSVWWGLAYIESKLFHVSFVLIPIRGGIQWDKPGRLLFLCVCGIISTLFFLIKDRGKNSGNQ
jgi:hypothetical protein